jgi:hypothetical protein
LVLIWYGFGFWALLALAWVTWLGSWGSAHLDLPVRFHKNAARSSAAYGYKWFYGDLIVLDNGSSYVL